MEICAPIVISWPILSCAFIKLSECWPHDKAVRTEGVKKNSWVTALGRKIAYSGEVDQGSGVMPITFPAKPDH
jgi:hypothetical protein